ncbi:MAG: triosephosphate isomerase [Bacteroidetes bacterium]|nr:triosephosphate isomerase [Bacteroidota bacterium]
MRKKIVAGNWKMNNTHKEGMELLVELFELLEREEYLLEGTEKKLPEVVIAPPFILLSDAAGLVQAWETKIAAQNCSSENNGAYTGEVSASMLKSINIDYVIIGHSERRNYFNETNQIAAKKISLALENNISVICCIGETLSERESGKQFQVITHQLEECLFHLSNDQMIKKAHPQPFPKGREQEQQVLPLGEDLDGAAVVIAYEPVWAIGTGKNATPELAQEMHHYIRSVMSGKFGKEISDSISILYGGSCNPKNAKLIFSQPDVDGGLIGGASLIAKDFVEVIKAAI